MGVTLAGFESLAVVEWDRWACDTIRQNQKRGFPVVSDWPLWEGDIREYDWSDVATDIDLLAGGPPCQPFSLGGKHRAHGDDRDMFPATVDIVRQLKPKAFLFENVKGLTRASFANYYQYILLQLEFPEITRKPKETWSEHLSHLQEEKTAGYHHSQRLSYQVIPTLVNAADYGVPQKRERVFMVGFRSDLGVEWSFPRPTHSYDALLYSQWISGEYWEQHRVPKRKRAAPSAALRQRITKLGSSLFPPEQQAWRTVRDALISLPDPQADTSELHHNHSFQDGARIYKGHTGSPLDLPAKTLKAGDHGVPGGENMMVFGDGACRYFTARESARLQTFPDGYVFHGSWSETMRQLGNAVPVALARQIAGSIAIRLAEVEIRRIVAKGGRQVA